MWRGVRRGVRGNLRDKVRQVSRAPHDRCCAQRVWPSDWVGVDSYQRPSVARTDRSRSQSTVIQKWPFKRSRADLISCSPSGFSGLYMTPVAAIDRTGVPRRWSYCVLHVRFGQAIIDRCCIALSVLRLFFRRAAHTTCCTHPSSDPASHFSRSCVELRTRSTRAGLCGPMAARRVGQSAPPDTVRER